MFTRGRKRGGGWQNTESRYGDNRNRLQNTDNRFGERRLNAIDRKTGEPSKCVICGSVFHWARNCPKRVEAKEYKRETKTVVSLFYNIYGESCR